MQAYHEIQPDALGAALVNGLVRTSRGDKGDDQMIAKTDHFLDACCPRTLKDHGVSRNNNLYAYLRTGNIVIDITNGSHLSLNEFVATSTGRVLELDVDPEKCFVSDLDAYDALRSAIDTHKNQRVLDHLAKSYWDKIVKLSDFNLSIIRRPEIMITYDLPPDKIRPL